MKLHDRPRLPGLYAFGLMFLVWQGCDDDSREQTGGVQSSTDAGERDAGERADATIGSAPDASDTNAGSGGAESTGAAGEAGSGGEGGSVGAAGGGATGATGASGTTGASGGAGKAGSSGPAGAGAGGAGSGGAAGEAAGSGGIAGAAEAGSGGASGATAGTGGAGSEAGAGGAAAGSGGSAGEPSVARCETRGGVTCDDDEFCNFEPDEDCGATDRGGMCEAKPEICTAIYAPVCGCDNRTYASSCTAHSAGISVKHDDACTPDECTDVGGRPESSDGASTPDCRPGEEMWSISGGIEPVVCCLPETVGGRTCGGIAALECDDGDFCNYEEAAGGQGCDGSVADAGGKCQSIPSGCTSDYRPVCGCDKHSYSNACEAHSNGVPILHDGACNEIDCASVAGRVVYGIGPAPMCAPGEDEFTFVVDSSGATPIEGAICCTPSQ